MKSEILKTVNNQSFVKMFKAFCFLILAAGFVSAQKPKVSRNQNEYVPKIVARAGWTTPVFAPNLTENISRVNEIANPSEISTDIDIKTRQYFLTEERLVQAESCDERISALDKRNTLVVRHFTVYEYKGRIFAYKLPYYGTFAENGVVSGYAGCFRPAMYVDEDGDGKFKLQCGNESVYLPQWIYEAENGLINLLQGNWTSVLFTNVIETSAKRSSVYLEQDNEMIGFDAKTFLFDREKLVNLELCIKNDGVQTTKKPIWLNLADRFITYEIQGRIFAYEIPVSPLKISRLTEPSTKEVPTGCMVVGRSYVFMDEDGDGTFEQNCNRTALTPLPRWVRDLGQIKVRASVKN